MAKGKSSVTYRAPAVQDTLLNTQHVTCKAMHVRFFIKYVICNVASTINRTFDFKTGTLRYQINVQYQLSIQGHIFCHPVPYAGKRKGV